jgi:non-canonical poly(A) RNA polymerase PAPD5/7
MTSIVMQFFRWIEPILLSHRVIAFPDKGLSYLDAHQPPPDHPDFAISTHLSTLIRSLISTRADIALREHIISLVSQRIRAALTDLHQPVIVVPGGSSLSGTCLPESDIDLALFSHPFPMSTLLIMDRLKENLLSLVWPDSFQAIPQATVAVLKFTVDPGIQIDLVIDELHGALYVPSIRNLFTTFPVILPAQMFFKCVLRKHELDQPYTGGIASYTLQIMILAYLQHSGEKPFFIDFIRGFCDFYGTEFNFTLTGIDVVGDGRLFCRADEGKLALQSPTTMHIIDPFKAGNVLGHNSYRIQDLRAVLKEMAKILEDGKCTRWDAEFQSVLGAAAQRQGIVEEYVRENEIGIA